MFFESQILAVPELNLNTSRIDPDVPLSAPMLRAESRDHIAGLQVAGLQPASSGLVAHWIGGSGNWSDPTKWDIGVVPNNSGPTSHQVVIDVSGTPTITVDQSVTISSLNNAEMVFVVFCLLLQPPPLRAGQRQCYSG